MLIFKAMWIPDIHKSSAELLSSRKYHTNLPMIDISQKMYEPEIENLVDKMSKCHQYRQRVAQTGCWYKGII